MEGLLLLQITPVRIGPNLGNYIHGGRIILKGEINFEYYNKMRFILELTLVKSLGNFDYCSTDYSLPIVMIFIFFNRAQWCKTIVALSEVIRSSSGLMSQIKNSLVRYQGLDRNSLCDQNSVCTQSYCDTHEGSSHIKNTAEDFSDIASSSSQASEISSLTEQSMVSSPLASNPPSAIDNVDATSSISFSELPLALSYYSFPAILYDILEKEDPSIIEWLENGNAFQIKSMKMLENIIIPKYFKRK